MILLLLPAPVWAAEPNRERIPLTLELLQERLDSPIQQEGVATIDLRQLTINLTPENAEFRKQFYQFLQSSLNRSKNPLGIDLSKSLLQGKFDAQELGLQTPLVAEALSPLLSQSEQEPLQQDPQLKKLSPSVEQAQRIPYVTVFRGPIKLVETEFKGAVNFADTFFLQRFEAARVTFSQESNWSQTRFIRFVDFDGAIFVGDANFTSSSFFEKANFKGAQWQGIADFTKTDFAKSVDFEQAEFTKLANWMRSHWQAQANFAGVTWRDRALFSKSRFLQSVCFANATFEKAAAFRETRFNAVVDFSSVNLLEQVDFSNAVFAQNAYLNVSSIAFDSDQAKIIGETGKIGSVISLPKLEGNENVLRSLVLNFRSLEQIPDANRLEYTTERLRLKQLGERLLGTPLNRVFRFGWGEDVSHWLGLNLLLLLSDYGTNFSLVLSAGIVAIAYFGLLFWLIDRARRRIPKPILPTTYEVWWVLSSFFILTLSGVTGIFQTAHQPWLTLACISVILIPVPLLLLARLYQQGRYHDLIDVTYFVEDAERRQLRLLIVRLPIMPRFYFFRDRYMPILWDRRWSWLNYYDFSLNNWLKLGFNDIRLRDQHLPGIVTSLVWYQWSLGILYVALLLWTLSRTIPGLNLLIYLR